MIRRAIFYTMTIALAVSVTLNVVSWRMPLEAIFPSMPISTEPPPLINALDPVKAHKEKLSRLDKVNKYTMPTQQDRDALAQAVAQAQKG